MFLFCLDEGEKTKHDSMYDAFPNVAKKRKPSRQEVTDFALVPKTQSVIYKAPVWLRFVSYTKPKTNLTWLTTRSYKKGSANKCFVSTNESYSLLTDPLFFLTSFRVIEPVGKAGLSPSRSSLVLAGFVSLALLLLSF